jgi:hypothetical protein
MSNVKVDMEIDAQGDLIDVIYYHGYCAPDGAENYPAPESLDYLVYCKVCGDWIEEIPLTDDGAQQLLEDKFFAAYVDCALWSSHDEDADGAPLDRDFTGRDIDVDALARMYADCRDFWTANREDLKDIDSDQAGHDFWLTRNHHGAGFWDRGLGEIGQRLTDAAHVYGESNLYSYRAHNGQRKLNLG